VAHKEFTNLNVSQLIKEKSVIYDVKGTLTKTLIDARL